MLLAHPKKGFLTTSVLTLFFFQRGICGTVALQAGPERGRGLALGEGARVHHQRDLRQWDLEGGMLDAGFFIL